METKKETLSLYESMLNKKLNEKMVKYYKVATFYLAIGGDNYELTPADNTQNGHKKAQFISANIGGKKLLFLNPSYFKDGIIPSEKIRALNLNDAFEISDNSGEITGFTGAEIDVIYDKYGEKLIGVIKKGKIELNHKKLETKEENTLSQPEIKNNKKFIEKAKEKTLEENTIEEKPSEEKPLEEKIKELEEKVKQQQKTIIELEQVVDYQQKVTFSIQQQFLEISRLFKELLKEIKEKTNDEIIKDEKVKVKDIK